MDLSPKKLQTSGESKGLKNPPLNGPNIHWDLDVELNVIEMGAIFAGVSVGDKGLWDFSIPEVTALPSHGDLR